ncbi:Eukaryotic translation initiation factor 3 subunit H [Porphyridium purpureum]|uniref:Eukaryotic translation initiation factor 3 subunit H n=1 Tax=Porphyridium purpureum TaxID=35688 RepID=A0A5J4YWI7_PORPP|nr:Eukaryotic translation initiation factor 3 subunit H [Porphyridium purpureum]|eukprot:POR4523..scf209_3
MATSAKLPRAPRITQIELDALAVMKIIKHCQETYPLTVAGQLLGMEMGTALQITNCYSFPQSSLSSSGDDLDNVEVDQSLFQMEMMKCVREVNIDHQVVGWYQSSGSQMGSFLTSQWIDTQVSYQTNLDNCVSLIYDPIRTVDGTLFLRAYRLTDAFLKLHAEGNFSSYAFARHKLTAGGILDEIPVKIRNASLINALITSLELSPEVKGEHDVAIDRLREPNKPVVEQTLDYIINDMDELTRDQSKYTFFLRNFSRSAAPQMDAFRRKQAEAEARNISSEFAFDDPALYHALLSEPSRMDTKLILRDLQSYMESVNSLSRSSLLRRSAVHAIQTNAEETDLATGECQHEKRVGSRNISDRSASFASKSTNEGVVGMDGSLERMACLLWDDALPDYSPEGLLQQCETYMPELRAALSLDQVEWALVIGMGLVLKSSRESLVPLLGIFIEIYERSEKALTEGGCPKIISPAIEGHILSLAAPACLLRLAILHLQNQQREAPLELEHRLEQMRSSDDLSTTMARMWGESTSTRPRAAREALNSKSYFRGLSLLDWLERMALRCESGDTLLLCEVLESCMYMSPWDALQPGTIQSALSIALDRARSPCHLIRSCGLRMCLQIFNRRSSGGEESHRLTTLVEQMDALAIVSCDGLAFRQELNVFELSFSTMIYALSVRRGLIDPTDPEKQKQAARKRSCISKSLRALHFLLEVEASVQNNSSAELAECLQCLHDCMLPLAAETGPGMIEHSEELISLFCGFFFVARSLLLRTMSFGAGSRNETRLLLDLAKQEIAGIRDSSARNDEPIRAVLRILDGCVLADEISIGNSLDRATEPVYEDLIKIGEYLKS